LEHRLRAVIEQLEIVVRHFAPTELIFSGPESPQD
jgi:hypothetical protein